jgi:EmrB/QacA subfamily drug resistance transporter
MSGNRSPWLVLIAMTGSLSMIMLDQTVVAVALPSMSSELPLSPVGQQWVLNAYVLALAALVALGGKLGDKVGGVTTFRAGVAVFFVASALCGLAPQGVWGEPWIIGARALQGVGAALMMPVSASIVISAFTVNRGRAMAVYVGISQVFLAIGPLLGGLLTETVSWRSVFWLNVPVGIVALVMVQVARPDNQRQPQATIKAGPVALLVVGIAATVLALQQASVWSWTSPATWIVLITGLVLTTAFTVGQLRSTDPLVNVRLFGRRAFLGDTVVLGLLQFGLLATILFSSFYLQDLIHLSPMIAGLALLPLILAIAAAAQLGGRWYDRAGVRPPVLTGLTLATAGMVAWAASLPQLGYGLQVPGMVLTGFGLGLIISPTNTDALGRVARTERSQASGLVQTIRQLGGTLGVAVIGTIVLGIEHQGTRTPTPQHAADAIAIGFGCAAVVFAIALCLGWRLLSPERLSQPSSGADDSRHAGVAAKTMPHANAAA